MCLKGSLIIRLGPNPRLLIVPGSSCQAGASLTGTCAPVWQKSTLGTFSLMYLCFRRKRRTLIGSLPNHRTQDSLAGVKPLVYASFHLPWSQGACGPSSQALLIRVKTQILAQRRSRKGAVRESVL